MNHTSITTTRKATLVLSLIMALILGGLVAFAEEMAEAPDTLPGVTFPISELGGCADKTSCKAYCDEGAHMSECVAFAEAHGLMSKADATRAKTFATHVKQKSGPGGCDSPKSCRSYCEDISHIEECVAFAERNGFMGEEFAEGKKLSVYLKQGGSMPGGCTSRESCEMYCSDLTHAEECALFAEKAGLSDDGGENGTPGRHGDAMPSAAQMRALAELAKKGEMPGGCRTKNECEAYCADESHGEECLAFAEKAGFMTKEDAQHARTMMSQGGPGGCKSREACEIFCNVPENREECFRFAEANGLIPKEELKQMKEGLVRMREGVESAPEEVRDCLRSTLGPTIIEDIQAGKLIPGREIGERMHSCFEAMGGEHDPVAVLKQAPPEVAACVKEKLGTEFDGLMSGTTEPTPEMADAFRVCFQTMEMKRGRFMEEGGGGSGQYREGTENTAGEMVRGLLRSAPPEVAACLKEKLGDRFASLESGTEMPTPEIGVTMRTCFESFHRQGIEMSMPQMPVERAGSIGGSSGPSPMPSGQGSVKPEGLPLNMPPEVMACVKEKLGSSYESLGRIAPTSEMSAVMRACYDAHAGNFEMASPPVMPTGMSPSGSGADAASVWTNNLPENVRVCLRNKFGAETFTKIGYQPPTPDVELRIKECFAELRAEGIQISPAPEIQPLPVTAPQSRGLTRSLIGAVAASFTALWGLVR